MALKKPLIEQGKDKLAMQFAFSLIRKNIINKKVSSFQNAKSRLGFAKVKLAMQFALSLIIKKKVKNMKLELSGLVSLGTVFFN